MKLSEARCHITSGLSVCLSVCHTFKHTTSQETFMLDFLYFIIMKPSHHKIKDAGREAQLVAHLTQEPEVPGSIPGSDTYFRLSFC